MGGESRTVLKFHPRLAPIKAAVFPLVKRDGMPEHAEKTANEKEPERGAHRAIFADGILAGPTRNRELAPHRSLRCLLVSAGWPSTATARRRSSPR